PVADTVDQATQFAEFGRICGTTIDGGNGCDALAAADFCNGRGQGGVIIIMPILARAETIDRALDRAQRLATPQRWLGRFHLIAQIPNALGQTTQCTVIPCGAGKAALNLIEQRDQLATQRLPLPATG